jgi:predicted permease
MMRRHRMLQDLDQQIRDHIDHEIEDNLQRGMSLEEARTAAYRKFGNVGLVKEDARAVWVSIPLEHLLQDLRFGCRILTKSPALSATAILLVALVIGGNTTVFSIAHGILNKPAPGVRSANLVRLNWIDDRGQIDNESSYPNFEDLRAQSQTLRPMFAAHFHQFTLSHAGGSYAIDGAVVSRDYFESLGVELLRGSNVFQEESRGPTSDLAAVISHRGWMEYFEGAEDILGRPMLLNGRPAVVVGVAAPPFRGAFIGESLDVWVALVPFARATGEEPELLNRSESSVTVTGRLAPGVSLREANAELTGIWTRLRSTYPDLDRSNITLVPYSAVAGGGSGLDRQGDRVLAIFSIVTLLTVVIVCANVANLLLARATVRQREMALRQSLGAPRGRIIRMLIAEGLVIASLAAVAAFLLAWWVATVIPRFFPPGELMTLATMDVTPDWMVAGYAVALAALALVAFTLVPAIRSWRLELLPWLKAGEQGVVQGQSRLSGGLVVVQLAFSVLLLTSAGLAYRSLFLMDTHDPGFNRRNLLLVTVNTAGSVQTADAHAALLDRLRERLQELPAVQHVTYARRIPFQGFSWGRYLVETPGSAGPGLRAEGNHVGPDYLGALGISPVAGREFAPGEGASTIRSAMISQNLAEALWPGQSPLGRALLLVGPQGDREPPVEVVGVTPDGFFSGFRRDRSRFIFLSAQREPAAPGRAALYVRYVGNLDAIAPAISRRLREADPRAPIMLMRTMESQVEEMIWPVRAVTILLLLFAGGSLLISAIGQYAVVSFDMRRRVREIGLRLALGASSNQVLSSTMREGLRLTILGLAIGFALSVAVGRVLGSVLFGVTPTDPPTYLTVFSLLSAASLLACYVPARVAANASPMTALRQE